VREGVDLVGVARCAIDVSDGLAGDLGHLVRASQVRGVVEEVALLSALRPELRRVSPLLRRKPLEFALFGGEDYALLATGPAASRPASARRIGRIEAGRGTFLEGDGGKLEPLGAAFDHFRRAR
jgi:thiamine-monophosphate kinase